MGFFSIQTQDFIYLGIMRRCKSKLWAAYTPRLFDLIGLLRRRRWRIFEISLLFLFFSFPFPSTFTDTDTYVPRAVITLYGLVYFFLHVSIFFVFVFSFFCLSRLIVCLTTWKCVIILIYQINIYIYIYIHGKKEP
jgi:hypothetical protein